MLDKSIEYKNIIMRIEKDNIAKATKPTLPEGFSFKLFNENDALSWSEIETSVLEFSSVEEANEYFTKTYLPYKEELKARCLFITDKKSIAVATATAWYAKSELGYQAMLNWVSVRPEYQGLGLGKAIVQKALEIFTRLDPDCSVWLHTQTWSHVAIRLYHGLGFNLLKKDRLANMNTKNGIPKTYQNDFNEAINILTEVLDEDTLTELMNTAI